MNKASVESKKIIDPKWLSFRSTAEFARNKYRNHCGPTAITNLLITLAQARDGRLVDSEEAVEIFDRVASFGRRLLVYNIRFGTTDLLLGLFARLVFFRLSKGSIRVGFRHFLNKKSLNRTIGRGNFALLELFGHPLYGWHQMLIYGMDESGDYIACDGIADHPVHIPPADIGRGLFLEIKTRSL